MQELFENKPEYLAEKATRDSSLLSGIFERVSSTDPKLKFKSAKILALISKKDPQKLYPRINFFIDLLGSENSILQWNAIDVVANLASVDVDKSFDGIFGKFYGLLRQGSLITACHVVGNSGKIANARPDLEGDITKELLKVEGVRLPTEECRNILLGYAILSFDQYFDKIKNKDEVISFARRQLKNSRSATRAKAERFLKKHAPP